MKAKPKTKTPRKVKENILKDAVDAIFGEREPKIKMRGAAKAKTTKSKTIKSKPKAKTAKPKTVKPKTAKPKGTKPKAIRAKKVSKPQKAKTVKTPKAKRVVTAHQHKIGRIGIAYNQLLFNELAGHTVKTDELRRARAKAKLKLKMVK
jgi:hypothetical protein